MFIQHVGLSPTPRHASIQADTIGTVLKRMTGDAAGLQGKLDAGFRRLELRQPDLSVHLAQQLTRAGAPAAQTLGYFLFVFIHEVFDEAFGGRLAPVGPGELRHLALRLVADGELRGTSAFGDSYSEDVIALGQPSLVQLVREEVDRVVDELRAPNIEGCAGAIHEAALLEIVALSHAVSPA